MIFDPTLQTISCSFSLRSFLPGWPCAYEPSLLGLSLVFFFATQSTIYLRRCRFSCGFDDISVSYQSSSISLTSDELSLIQAHAELHASTRFNDQDHGRGDPIRPVLNPRFTLLPRGMHSLLLSFYQLDHDGNT
ncbi:uncharacterized protein LY89DRAFT_266856 [Mollisia scopiformis]|uniref:Uncharacterized protein n=1 Tax=Mollisia scopiformis TaxID=149040 RepID=A0A132BDP6_MOLSC|nr:uncharacterized protein LY89DRAFT_266856 [Mollisia scopiformis]KUJ09954.1 hypothetical protein LY89DRAFT_266856 [Mollisia scopiformis]